jgi:predicted benzoate:H+ symporter BenE
MPSLRGERFILSVRELNGALGDLGTLLPLMLGTIAVVGLAPIPVLIGFALFYIGTAIYYRLPIPVQPMKAVAAVLLTTAISPAGLATSGFLIGAALFVMGLTGWITWLARMVPQSVLAGLQLGLGIALAIVSVDLMSSEPIVGGTTLLLLVGLLFVRQVPSALIALVFCIVLAYGLGLSSSGTLKTAAPLVSLPALPSLPEFQRALSMFVLPQLSLTLTNAVVLTALIAGDYFGERAAHVIPSRLAISSGLANLLLCPFGALPMCHGAGGLAAHYRFGARSGTAPLALGLVLLAFALLPGSVGLTALQAVPQAGLGALLLVASSELALTPRLFDSKPSCWPVILVTAAVTVWTDPFWGLLAGSGSELMRLGFVRLLWRDKEGRTKSQP